jgi:hypothetical protein
LLGSLLEWEYLAGLNMISMILKNLDLTDNKLIQQLLGTLPHKWPSGFDGLLRPLLRGLSSSETESTCIDIINSLLFVSVPVFLDSRPSKFLFVSLANAPRLLQIYSDNTNQESIEENLKIADLLALAGSSSNCDSLARLFTAYANQRISKAQDFLKQLVLIIRDEFALFQWEVIRFCLGLLRNKLEFYPECALLLLEYMLKDLPPWTEAQSQEMEFSEAWLMPLIGLLDTPQYSKAAHVLDALLSGRIKSTEAEMTTIVGGSHNLYNYVKRARTLKIPDYTETGWIKEKESGDVRKRIVTVAKSCEQLEKPKIYKPVQKLVVNNRNDLLQQFKELEIFFRSSLSQPQE